MAGEDATSRKKRTFDELYALDESGDEGKPSVDEGLVSSLNALKGKIIGDPTVPTPSNKGKSTSLARSLSIPFPQKNINQGRSAPLSFHSDDVVKDTPLPPLKRHHSITGLQLLEQAAAPSPTAPPSSIVPPSSTAPPSSSIPRANGRKKRDADIKLVPEQLQIFRNLHFYFFNNDDINPGRRKRIIKALEYGATWQKDWNSSVTHIVLDSNLIFDHVKTKVKDIPDHVIVVDESYPADCIKFRLLVDPLHRQYRVKGYNPPSHKTTIKAQPPQPPPKEPSQLSDTSLKLKPPGKAVMARQPQTQATTGTEETSDAPSTRELSGQSDASQIERNQTELDKGDDLDVAIREAKGIEFESELNDETSNTNVVPSLPEGQTSSAPTWQQKFQCMHKHTGKTNNNPNAYTMSILLELADHYAQIRDEWRPKAYRSAIAALRRCPTKITSKQEALRLPGIGESIAEKIEEIVITNRLRKLDYTKLDPRERILQDFTRIYGVGHDQAAKWYAAGHRNLDDLSQRAILTTNQKIGLTHYTDFNTRIPRSEVEQHAQVARDRLARLDPSYTLYTMGSYRRGAETSGDIDLLITAGPSTPIHAICTLVLSQLVPSLTASGFLVAALATTSAVHGTKWHGASVLPSSPTKIWRRIDFLLVPYAELGAALIYFTGNDIFNRSLRLLASKKGMRLNQRGLFRDVMKDFGREKLSDGTLVEGRDERKIFEALGVPWRPPEHRIC